MGQSSEFKDSKLVSRRIRREVPDDMIDWEQLWTPEQLAARAVLEAKMRSDQLRGLPTDFGEFHE